MGFMKRSHLFHVIPPFNALVVVVVNGPVNYILNPIFERLSLVYLFCPNILLVLLKYRIYSNKRPASNKRPPPPPPNQTQISAYPHPTHLSE